MVYKYNIIICYGDGFTVVVIFRKWVMLIKGCRSHCTYKCNKHNIKMIQFSIQKYNFIKNVRERNN